MQRLQDVIEVLRKYIPENSVEPVSTLFKKYSFLLKITKSRRSKTGDYSHPGRDSGHIITVNHDLNKYAFLITFIHEVAHMSCWEKNKNNVAPHGIEWKSEFRHHLEPFLHDQIFPNELLLKLKKYILDPAASSCNDVNLMRELKKYNHNYGDFFLLEELSENSLFALRDGRIFVKGKLLRKRYKCIEVSSKKNYLISPVAEVKEVPAL
ncbi:SprT-like domain-containing protein [soil metagenome]